MRERPILFSGPMVRAILDGRKTQTRRVVKRTSAGYAKEPGGHRRWHLGDPEAVLACPFGQPGDRLWVRETWAALIPGEYTDSPYPMRGMVDLRYRASEPELSAATRGHRWRPSIHMPRWACRQLLDVVSVRVERLQDISEADAQAEGLTKLSKDNGRVWKFGIPDRDGQPGTDDDGWSWREWQRDPRNAFALLWCATYGAESWDANPCVWVVEFAKAGGRR